MIYYTAIIENSYVLLAIVSSFQQLILFAIYSIIYEYSIVIIMSEI